VEFSRASVHFSLICPPIIDLDNLSQNWGRIREANDSLEIRTECAVRARKLRPNLVALQAASEKHIDILDTS